MFAAKKKFKSIITLSGFKKIIHLLLSINFGLIVQNIIYGEYHQFWLLLIIDLIITIKIKAFNTIKLDINEAFLKRIKFLQKKKFLF